MLAACVSTGLTGSSSVSNELFAKVLQHESGGQCPARRGTSGEIGPMQVMPATARGYGYKGKLSALNSRSDNCAKGIALGRRILGDCLTKAKGSWKWAVVCYNAGPGALQRRHIPRSTQQYLRAIDLN